MSALRLAKHVTGAPDLQIPHRDAEPGSQLGVLPDSREPFFRCLLEQSVPPVHQKRIGRPVRPADSSAELVELRKTHPVCVADDDRVDIRNVKSGLDDGRRDQDIHIAVHKVIHDVLDLLRVHAPVRIGDTRRRHHVLHALRHIGYRRYVIVDQVNLSSARHFPCDRFADGLLAVLHDKCLNRQPVLRRFLQYAHVAYPDQTHVQRARDRRRCQRQDIDILFHFLDLLLVRHAEALFLVDDQKTQAVKLHILRQKPVRPDDNVAHALLQIPDCLRLLGLRAEAAEQPDIDRIILHPLCEGIVVLLRQNGCRHQVGDLFSILHGLECGTDGNLRLAVADIPADESVHDLVRLHVLLGVLNRLQLILCLLKWKQLLEFMLPFVVRRERVTLLILTDRVQVDQFLRDLLDRRLHTPLCPGPFRSAKL